jgi:hypothetical protein
MPRLDALAQPSVTAALLPVRTSPALTRADRRHRLRHATTAGGCRSRSHRRRGRSRTVGAAARHVAGTSRTAPRLRAPISHCTAHADFVSFRAGSDGGSLVGATRVHRPMRAKSEEKLASSVRLLRESLGRQVHEPLGYVSSSPSRSHRPHPARCRKGAEVAAVEPTSVIMTGRFGAIARAFG